MRASGGAKRRRNIAPYIFIAPNLIVFTAFIFIPILGSFYVSLNEWSVIGARTFVGLDNYKSLLTDDIFWEASRNTGIYALGTVPTTMGFGLLVALGLNRAMPGRTLLRAIYFVPVSISLVAVGLISLWILSDDYGAVNNLLQSLGLPTVQWLSSTTWAMPSLIAVTIWIRLGFNMVIYLAALQGIPDELAQAAKVDGASGWQLFRYVTWPMLAPTSFLLVVLNVIFSLHVFDLIFVMTDGGPGFSTTVLVQYIYREAFQSGDMGSASAVGVVLYVVLMAFTLFYWRISKQSQKAS
ncbi:carbohydrate ABC transporter permease [Phytoactinopolyspora endophytica]|uniref:carbohydrate ABC transporter permease n=1 Tax=Phytoactinopolyspora endophytica TaxID=1642495 RepID=UPI00197C7EE7|nr:sugar ABC transporter permease [Phytoactinopolyspora endophytica]